MTDPTFACRQHLPRCARDVLPGSGPHQLKETEVGRIAPVFDFDERCHYCQERAAWKLWVEPGAIPNTLD